MSAPAIGQSAPPHPMQVLRTMMPAWVSRHAVPAASLAVISPRGRLDSLGYGLDPRQPARIASLSKAITGVCIARLIDEGRLSFDATLGTVLASTFERFGAPQDPRFGAVTIAQLLTHTSGFPREPSEPPRSGGMAAMLAQVLATPLEAPPGEEMVYSNVGYFLLGVVIEAVTGESYEQHCRRTTLEPMGASGFIDETLRARAPNGGWRVSAADYARFVQVWGPRGRLLGQPSLRWMAALPGQYGLGTYQFRLPTGTRYYHSGSVAGRERGGAYSYLFETGWTVVVIYEGDIGRAARDDLQRGLRGAFLARFGNPQRAFGNPRR